MRSIWIKPTLGEILYPRQRLHYFQLRITSKEPRYGNRSVNKNGIDKGWDPVVNRNEKQVGNYVTLHLRSVGYGAQARHSVVVGK